MVCNYYSSICSYIPMNILHTTLLCCTLLMFNVSYYVSCFICHDPYIISHVPHLTFRYLYEIFHVPHILYSRDIFYTSYSIFTCDIFHVPHSIFHITHFLQFCPTFSLLLHVPSSTIHVSHSISHILYPTFYIPRWNSHSIFYMFIISYLCFIFRIPYPIYHIS